MPTTMKATLKVEVSGSGTVSATQTLSVEACDKLEVTVPATDSLAVAVQPSDAGQVKLVLITAATYGNDVTYTVSGANGSADVVLDAPHLMAGTGAVALLGDEQKTITFANAGATDVAVQILVGRNASS